MKRLLLATCLLPVLTGCGFHLRNALLLPPDLGPVQVVGRDPHSQLVKDLTQAMIRAGAQVAPDGELVGDTSTTTIDNETNTPDIGTTGTSGTNGTSGTSGTVTNTPGTPQQFARLEIVSERWGSLPLSVDSQGRAQEFTLRYAVIFRLRRADGTDLVPQQVQELSRDYIATPTVATGTEGEREILVTELRRTMAGSILRRIDAVSRMAQEHPEQLPAPTPSPDAAPAPPQDGATSTP
jgi:LPS-assembly lipoprotein